MSFSSEIKQELSKTNNLKNKEELEYELIGYLVSTNVDEDKTYTKYATESEYNINRFNKLLSNLNIDYDISIQGNNYIIKLKTKDINIIKNNILNLIKDNKIKENFKKCFIIGAFMGSGSINNPNKTYHLEISLKSDNYANIVKNIIVEFGINFKSLNRNNSYSLYLKDGEQISNFLALIGASKAVLKFEEIRVIREMRNDINRKVNCETANLNKVINTAVRQIEDIKLIYKKEIKLPESLSEIAELRLNNPDASLLELGKMLKNPIGKSGVNHRLNKIKEIANNLRK